MASKEFHALQEIMAARPVAPPPATVQEYRARVDSMSPPLSPPDGVSVGAVTELGGVPVLDLTVADPKVTVIYLHGGGYRIGGPKSHGGFGAHLADRLSARVVVVDYRLAPEHPFPAAVDDAVAVYRAVLDNTEPGSIILAGDSAGGGLTVAVMLAAADSGLPRPAGGVCLSPWADLTNSVESYTTRADKDRLFSFQSASDAAEAYLAGTDPTHKFASPGLADLADLHDLPPLLIHIGDHEVLLDDARQLARRAQEAGVDVTIREYPEMPHVWHLAYPAYPEAVSAVDDIVAFVERFV